MHLDFSTLEAGLDEIRESPLDDGKVELIVRRPREDEREILTEAYLYPEGGLVGDDWLRRNPNPLAQITVMNVRAVALLAQARERWPLAGDQLYVDLDISLANLPAGTRLAIGEAVLEISEKPHTGCAKFQARFGRDAMLFVNSPVGRQLCLRGVNARVVRPGVIRVGDVARKV